MTYRQAFTVSREADERLEPSVYRGRSVKDKGRGSDIASFVLPVHRRVPSLARACYGLSSETAVLGPEIFETRQKSGE